MDWLHRITQSIATEAGADPESLQLSGEDVTTLLDLARIAAHRSGDRTNAPLLCYVLGIARAGGPPLDRLAATVREAAGEGGS